jgi:hypothetical protein
MAHAKHRRRSPEDAVRPSRRVQATIRWRREQREAVLRRFVARSIRLRWTPRLIQLLLDELLVGDELHAFIDIRLLPRRRYPQAVAVALALRHSYREDLLRAFLRRLR